MLLLPFIVALAIAISFKACGISRLGANKQLEVKLSQLPLPQGISISEVESKGMFVSSGPQAISFKAWDVWFLSPLLPSK